MPPYHPELNLNEEILKQFGEYKPGGSGCEAEFVRNGLELGVVGGVATGRGISKIRK